MFCLNFGRCTAISKDLLINEEIKDKEIRVIDMDGSQLGIMPTKDALKMALQKELDLVNIAPQANPPVCRVMDYGKYIFELHKKEKEAKKKQKIVSIKELKVSPTIEDHDFNVKMKQLLQFLKDGDKVKVTVKFRGREVNYASLGETVLNKFADTLGDAGTVEKKPKLEGKNMSMVVSPK
jgi:translation initiation factor IF-3